MRKKNNSRRMFKSKRGLASLEDSEDLKACVIQHCQYQYGIKGICITCTDLKNMLIGQCWTLMYFICWNVLLHMVFYTITISMTNSCNCLINKRKKRAPTTLHKFYQRINGEFMIHFIT